MKGLFFLHMGVILPVQCRTKTLLNPLWPYPSIHLPAHLPGRYSDTLPLLPAEVIPTSEDEKEAKDGEENDSVSCHHQGTGAPLDL